MCEHGMNLGEPWHVWKFLSSWSTGGFSTDTQLHGMCKELLMCVITIHTGILAGGQQVQCSVWPRHAVREVVCFGAIRTRDCTCAFFCRNIETGQNAEDEALWGVSLKYFERTVYVEVSTYGSVCQLVESATSYSCPPPPFVIIVPR
jgi:hypothetical protein